MLYIISSPTNACSAYEPRLHLFVDLYGGYSYLASAEWSRPYRSLKTSDKMCSPCAFGAARLKLVLGHARIAQSQQWRLTLNGSQSRNHGIYIEVSLKTKFKRYMQKKNDCWCVFWSRHCSRKGAMRAEE